MAIQRELWQNTIIEGLFADNSFMSKAVNDDMYVNMGKKVHIPNAGAPSAVEIDRSSLPAEVKTRTDVDVEYSLNELTTDPIRIPHAETVELSYSKRNSVISQDRLQLIEKAAEQMLYNWAPDSTHFVRTSGTKKVTAHTKDATGERKALVKADVLDLMTKFNADNIPQEGRYLLLDAYMYAQLLDDLTEGDQRAFFASADAQRGILGQLFSFNVMQRSQVLRYATSGTLTKWSVSGETSDNAAGLAWQTNSLSRALGEVKMFDSTDNPLYYGDIYSFLIRVGGTIRRNDKKGVYALVQDAAGE
jgi:hypothetical protein